ncbi:MAG TPA: EF-hand domain-containing protein [Gemmataceae bacterium]|nr:EF-hand domain-containing protein [Gemmataceae bacterium]
MKAHSLFAAVLAVLAGGTGVSPVSLGGTGDSPVSLGGTGVSPVGAAERDVQDFVYLGDKGPMLVRLHVRIDGKPLVDVWQDFMGKLFAYLDVDGDSVLSKQEAERVPPIPVLFNNGPGFGGQRPNLAAALDENQDGKITKKELASWYRRNGAGPFQFRTGGGDLEAQLRLRLVLAGQQQPLSADALNEKLFKLLDADKDGKLSRDELARAPSVLHKLDLDDDEMVSVQEMSGNSDSDQGSDVNVAFTLVQGAPRNNGPFLLVKSGETNKNLAQRLLTQYGRKGPKTPAKKLTRQDLGLDEASFKQLDMDEDGQLDREELARFAQRGPDLELRVRLGKKGDKEAAIEIIPSKERHSSLVKSIGPGADGTLLVELGTVQIEFGHAESSSEPQFAIRLRQAYLAQFRMADRDNNGYLDKNEAMQSRLYRNIFAMLDRDGDGKLFEKEVVAYLDRMKDLQESALRSCASLAIKDQGRGLFDMVDTNSDGRLSVRELRQMVKLVDQLDRDGDGCISRGEIPHKYRVDVRRGPAIGNQLAQRVVAVRRIGLNNQPALPDRAGPRWFQKMDRNHDGDVSRREFLGTDEAFRKIDHDGDGLISVEEAKRADDMFRKDKERKR